MDFGDGSRQPPRFPRSSGPEGAPTKGSRLALWALIAFVSALAIYGVYGALKGAPQPHRVTLRPGIGSGGDHSSGSDGGMQYGLPRRPGVAITLDGGPRRPSPTVDGQLGDLSSSGAGADADDDYGIVKPISGEEEMFCPSVYEPVCGSDGVTYSSACVLESVARALAKSARADGTGNAAGGGAQGGGGVEQGGLKVLFKGACENKHPTS